MNNFEPKKIKLASKHLEEKLAIFKREDSEINEIEEKFKKRKKTFKNFIAALFIKNSSSNEAIKNL